jgi:hypothetical protein
MLDSGPSGFKLKNFNAKIKLMEGNKIFKPNRLPPFLTFTHLPSFFLP